jgi:flagellar export protein FliJ
MARFVFELEAVLKQRRAIERERMVALAEVERARIALEDRLRAMHERGVEERAELSQQLGGQSGRGSGGLIDLRGVRFQTTAALKTRAHAQQLALQLAGVHKRIESARRELLEATTRRKGVETLKERRWEAWREEQRRLDARAMDEIATMRAGAAGIDAGEPIG